MSVLQERAIQLIHELSDDDISFLIELIERYMLPKPSLETDRSEKIEEGLRAFYRLDVARKEIKACLEENKGENKSYV